ncbi:putative transposase [Caloramator australicus RC3]|uniref:Mutator family transposase n=1 Tax=Caloramator australicus RC3 TaxID=857293 RepID=I7LKX4_9CLOT|nr:putative transposase [Caloramator australicus RC3]
MAKLLSVCDKSWENNWEVLIPFYRFPEEIRKIMYTTNIIEGFHRQLRKVTKSKAIFPNDESLEKMLFLVAKECNEKMDTKI